MQRMNFDLTDDQTLLQDTLRRFLHDRYSAEDRRRIVSGNLGWSSEHWRAFADELCILGLASLENIDGIDDCAVESMIVMDAFGEALVVEPFLETIVIGAGFLRRDASPRSKSLLADIAAGRARLAFACGEPQSRYALNHIATTAYRDGDAWRISGMKNVVSAAPSATHMIVSARTHGESRDPDGISLFLVEAGAAGLEMYPYKTIDERRAADVRFEDVKLPADALIGESGRALPLIELVMDEAIAALCAEATGAMRRLLRYTIEYTQQRRQFGQPLAQFQSLRHRMADMHMALERSRSAVLLAIWKLKHSPIDRALSVSAAKATIDDCGRFIGQNAIQLHGGMGLTQDLAVGRYFKRLTVIANQFGTIDYHLDRYARLSSMEGNGKPTAAMIR
jgi:alkylation response protein AidB-like acyl-CoA dehydrogenase